MSITYTWQVQQFKVKNETNQDGDVLQDAVCSVKWAKHGVDADGNRGIFGGVTGFTAYEVAVGDFVDFSALTEEVVLGWVQAKIVGDYADHIDEKIAAKIAAQAEQVRNPPWTPELAPGIPEAASSDAESATAIATAE